jgi:hypothetical protein
MSGVYEFPIDYTITIFAHARDEFEQTIIKSISKSVTSLINHLNPKEVITNSFSLSSLELGKLSKNGHKMLSCQIVLH